MISTCPFILFDGNCAEAMQFYQSCIGGELLLTKLKDTPMKDQMPEALHERITYAQLKNGMIEFSATDWLHPTRVPQQGNTVGIYIKDGSYDEMRLIFDKLAVGADPDMRDNLIDMPFGSYGHLADKYGVHWTFRGQLQHAA